MDRPTTDIKPVQNLQNGQLDSDELFHLALLDSQAARHDDAIRKLKEAVALSPEHAKATYLLGAEYAEIGLFDRAIDFLTRAIALDPSLTTAHFLLGLAYYSVNNIEAGKSAWRALDSMPGTEGMVAFKNALLQITSSQFVEAIAELDRGIALMPSGAALVTDMQRVKVNVEKHLLTLPQPEDGSTNKSGSSPNHMLLSNYQKLSDRQE